MVNIQFKVQTVLLHVLGWGWALGLGAPKRKKNGESEEKKILSAEPTGVGRFLLSKYLFLNFTRVNIWLRRKCFIQKL